LILVPSFLHQFDNIFIKSILCIFVSNPIRKRWRSSSLFCAVFCQPISNSLSFTISNNTHPFSFFPSSLLLSSQGIFAVYLNFHCNLLFFLQPQEKSVFFPYFVKQNCFVKNALVYWYTFTGYWMHFLSLCRKQLCCVKVNNSVVYFKGFH
jgi:hypothetical protein